MDFVNSPAVSLLGLGQEVRKVLARQYTVVVCWVRPIVWLGRAGMEYGYERPSDFDAIVELLA